MIFGQDKRRLPRKQRRKPSTDRASNLLETTIPTMYLLESCLPSPVAARVPSFWPCGLHFGPSFWLSGPSILAFWVFTLGFWAFHSQGSTALPGSSLVLLASLRLALKYYAPPPQRGKHHGCEKLRVFLASRPARRSSTSCRLLSAEGQVGTQSWGGHMGAATPDGRSKMGHQNGTQRAAGCSSI